MKLSNEKKQLEPSQQQRPVSKWTNHEHYHSGNIQNDIAVIEHGIFYETDRVRPIQGVVVRDQNGNYP